MTKTIKTMSAKEAKEFSENENFVRDYQSYVKMANNPKSLLDWIQSHPWLNELARRNREGWN